MILTIKKVMVLNKTKIKSLNIRPEVGPKFVNLCILAGCTSCKARFMPEKAAISGRFPDTMPPKDPFPRQTIRKGRCKP